jgi:hypothetical protein
VNVKKPVAQPDIATSAAPQSEASGKSSRSPAIPAIND